MRHVLLIEDELWLGRAYRQTLENAKYTVELVRDVREALEAVDKQPVDIIVLDMFLPEANGMQFLHELRSYHDTKQLPVIVCTANPGQVPDGSLKPYGVLTVLDKGAMTPAILLQAVYEVPSHADV
jgi:DNA-binding response OmpR family regulator